MKKRRGLTRVEIIVIVIIIIALFKIFPPMLEKFRPIPRFYVKCENNLKQLGLMYNLYCQDNNGSFISGIAGETDRDDWLVSLKPYYKVETKLLICPLAKVQRPDSNEYGGPNNLYQVSIKKDDSQKISMESSYGINCWVYNPPSDSNLFSSRSSEDFWRTNDISNVSKVPLFADSMWVGGYPKPNGKAGEPPSENGQWDGVDAEMKHFCIDRHSGAINMVFMDGHIEEVGLKRLWKLKWHKNFDTSGPWSKLDAPWLEWMKEMKDK